MNITISSFNRVCKKFKKQKFDGMISINDPKSDRIPGCVAHKTLLLYFRDSHPGRRKRGCCTESHIRHIVQFASEFEAEHSVLVNCQRGRCRSTAAAIIALNLGYGMPAALAVRQIMKASKNGNPNGWMLHLADTIYGATLYDNCRKLWRVKFEREDFPNGY